MSLQPGDLVRYRPFKGVPTYALVMRPPLNTPVRETEIMWMGDPYTANFGEIGMVVEKNLELVSRAGEE
ncbi:MAG: hypothetical protein EBZ49_08925 [Proteobacteria bacterium]|nr:hypothetical protein [Pseudomonadota bacterium]